ncbi:unnamed protein product [marine sediment metagenome]|uniref:Uncharacterized protein n=1 Tax=marine sediment metagenome TaxID=412755 RepID=X1STG8_9ZZZZ
MSNNKLLEKFEELEKPVKIQDLKPPKPIIIEEVPEEEFFIDFNRIANNSSFQRFILETIKTCVPHLKSVSVRTSKDIMSKNFSNKITEIGQAVKVYDEIREIGRGSHQDFREVVSELKEALAKRKAKIEIKVQD